MKLILIFFTFTFILNSFGQNSLETDDFYIDDYKEILIRTYEMGSGFYTEADYCYIFYFIDDTFPDNYELLSTSGPMKHKEGLLNKIMEDNKADSIYLVNTTRIAFKMKDDILNYMLDNLNPMQPLLLEYSDHDFIIEKYNYLYF